MQDSDNPLVLCCGLIGLCCTCSCLMYHNEEAQKKPKRKLEKVKKQNDQNVLNEKLVEQKDNPYY